MKKNNKHLLIPVLATSLLTLSTGSQAASLVQRTSDLIYDSDTNRTWMQNADLNGTMTWYQAMNWADNLVYGGYDDWRLPSYDEMDHLFYVELGAEPWHTEVIKENSNYDLFSNFQFNAYWTSDEVQDPQQWGDAAYIYDTLYGVHNYYVPKDGEWYAWAIRDGDVTAPSSVPVPGAIWLMGSGLLGLMSLRKRTASDKNAQC
jgi:hypothetical protein